MLEATEAIREYVGRGRAVFDADPAIRDAILYRIVILGEAAKAAIRADPSLESKLPDVEWSPIARMKDRLTHHYWRNDPEIVWSTASRSVPELQKALEGAIARLSDDRMRRS